MSEHQPRQRQPERDAGLMAAKLYFYQVGDKVDMTKEWKIVAGKDFEDAAMNVVREKLVSLDQILAPGVHRVHLMERDSANPTLEGVNREVHTMKVEIGES